MASDLRRGIGGGLMVRLAQLPRRVIHGVLDEVLGYLSGADLTDVLLSAVDLNRVLDSVDLQALVERLDLNRILATVDLEALLERVDLDAALARVDLDAALARVDLDAALARVDLNRLIAGLDLNPAVQSLELEPVITRIDLNKVLTGVDIDAVLARTDLVGVATVVVDGIDLNAIVRDASSTVTTEMITDVRSGSERADDRVEQFVNRLLRRDGDPDSNRDRP